VAGYPVALDTYQWAREATFGTDLAATSRVLVERLNFTPQSEFARPTVVRGLLQRNRGFETPVKRWSQWEAEGPVSYEQLQNWLCMIQNVASPTGSGPYVWTHTINPATVPAPKSFVFERQVTDGSSPIVHAWHAAMAQSLEISGADGELLRFSASGFARRIQTGESLTGALSLPTPEMPPTPLTTLFIDDDWASLGGTQVSAQILGFTVRFNTGYKPIWTLDGRTDLDYTTYVVDASERSIEATITCLLGSHYATERAAAEAGTLRAVRLAVSGSGDRELEIDFLAKHERPELFEFGEQEGQHVVTLSLQESTDGTNLARFVLTNNVSAFA
jgi:hypothetical protein